MKLEVVHKKFLSIFSDLINIENKFYWINFQKFCATGWNCIGDREQTHAVQKLLSPLWYWIIFFPSRGTKNIFVIICMLCSTPVMALLNYTLQQPILSIVLIYNISCWVALNNKIVHFGSKFVFESRLVLEWIGFRKRIRSGTNRLSNSKTDSKFENQLSFWFRIRVRTRNRFKNWLETDWKRISKWWRWW